jgi:hypothetical protein
VVFELGKDFAANFEALVGTNFESFAIDIPGTLVERIGELARAGALDWRLAGRLDGRADLLNFMGFLENVIGTNCNTEERGCTGNEILCY